MVLNKYITWPARDPRIDERVGLRSGLKRSSTRSMAEIAVDASVMMRVGIGIDKWGNEGSSFNDMVSKEMVEIFNTLVGKQSILRIMKAL